MIALSNPRFMSTDGSRWYEHECLRESVSQKPLQTSALQNKILFGFAEATGTGTDVSEMPSFQTNALDDSESIWTPPKPLIRARMPQRCSHFELAFSLAIHPSGYRGAAYTSSNVLEILFFQNNSLKGGRYVAGH